MRLEHIVYLGCLVLTLLTACTERPARIEIKGPLGNLNSKGQAVELPVFERKGDTVQLRASALDEKEAFMGPAKVRWESSDRRVATVDQSGLVTLLSSGKADIIASTTEFDPPLSDSQTVAASIIAKLRITSPPEGEVIELPLGEKLAFKAEVLNDNGEVIPDAKITWSASSYSATIENGEVEGRALGTASIMAECKGGFKDRRDINVTDWPSKKPAVAHR